MGEINKKWIISRPLLLFFSCSHVLSFYLRSHTMASENRKSHPVRQYFAIDLVNSTAKCLVSNDGNRNVLEIETKNVFWCLTLYQVKEKKTCCVGFLYSRLSTKTRLLFRFGALINSVISATQLIKRTPYYTNGLGSSSSATQIL